MDNCELNGQKAFLPRLHDGVPIVAEVEYRNPHYRPVPGKRFETFDEADVEAWKMNQNSGISSDVSWRIHESVKNADV